MIETYLATLAGVALAQASPGPNMLAVTSIALGKGRNLALWTVVGVSCAMLVWAVAVALGLGLVVELFPSLLTAMKIVGGLYLLWIAAKALLAARTGGTASVRADERELTTAQAGRRGFLVVLTNPKAALMWTAVGTFQFGAGLSATEVALFGPLAALSAFLIYGGYGWLFSTGLAVRAYRRFSRVIEAMLGVVFGGLGGRLVWDGVGEWRGAA